MANEFQGVKVFSATKARERELLGELVTDWLRSNNVEIVDKIVTQSSDSEFHCITITIFYRFVKEEALTFEERAERSTKPAPKRINFNNGPTR